MRTTKQDAGQGGRFLGGLVLFLLLTLVAAALVAPHVFNLLIFLARRWPALEGMRDIEFEKVAGRCALIAVALGLIPALKLSGLYSLKKLGLPRDRRWMVRIAKGWLLGTGSMLVLLALGWAMGAYSPKTDVGVGVVGTLALYLVGALVVGLIEEPIFRGAIFGMLHRGFGLVGAAMLASVIYSAAHFAGPDPPMGVVHGQWYSGLYLLGHMFTPVDLRWGFGFMFVSLFAIGMVLCILYAYYESLYFGIGLHAGWVWVMRTGNYVFTRNQAEATMLFGPSMSIAKAGVTMLMAALFLVAVSVAYRRRVSQAGSHGS